MSTAPSSPLDSLPGQPPEGNVQALFHSFLMIIASEIGDKTFLIAAILAMRHPRLIVFAGAFGSLVVMSILSAAMGHILPTLIPRKWTQVAAAVLFFVFGTKMMIEGRQMKAGSDKIMEEFKEAEEEIEVDDAEHDGTGRHGPNGEVIPLEDMEAGTSHPTPPKPAAKSWTEGARNFCSLLLGPVFVQAFALTFLGEWGDRSQIATIALGAAHVRELYLFMSVLELTTVPERISGIIGYHSRTRLLYGRGCHRWSLHLNQNLSEARSVSILVRSLFPILTGCSSYAGRCLPVPFVRNHIFLRSICLFGNRCPRGSTFTRLIDFGLHLAFV